MRMSPNSPDDLVAMTLESLRTHLRSVSALEDEVGLERFAERLQGDARSGAQALAKSARARLDGIVKERTRVERMFELRKQLFADGYRAIAGVDEVGVGPLAGPVVAAAVILPEHVELRGVNDSKKLQRYAREKLSLAIREQAIAVSVGSVTPREIDQRNIFQASLEAMRRAVDGLHPAADFCLVDARTIPGVAMTQRALIHGDAIDASIAAASIVAKVHRDQLMVDYDAQYPGYGFARHMGYGTEVHLDALDRLGPCAIHRRSFAPVAASLGPLLRRR